jgi:hypothetical protein
MSDQITFDAFRKEWLDDITQDNPSTVELGNRFSRKLITQWLDLAESSDDIVYCDGTGDGGIDIACLHRGDDSDESTEEGDTWYLVQGKYGSAFSGTGTLLREAQKVVDTLDGNKPNLSSLAQGLLERLSTFRAKASDRDKLVLVFATVELLNDEEKRAMDDIRALGRSRLGAIFDVETVSVATIYQRMLETKDAFVRIRIPIKAQLVTSDEGLLVGSVKLTDLYAFLKTYRAATGDLDQLYEKNVRRFLGTRGKVNKAIQMTLDKEPEQFGLYNNGITFVVEDVKPLSDNTYELIEPYIVNGCQTTRTIWEVLFKKIESGGTGSNSALERWQARLEKGIVITKIVKVGFKGEDLLTQITRYTNSQNAVREKDFIALTRDFQMWAKQMAEWYNIFLEIQRGGWDSRRALQRQNPNARQFTEWINAFDLLKVYGAGWLGEAGLAYGKNPPFLPNGAIFKRTVNNPDDADPFGLDDLYAAYLLHKQADKYQFGRGAKKDTRRQTRFLFYMVTIELLKYVMIHAQIERTNHNISQCLLKILQDGSPAGEALLDTAIRVIDEYLTQGADDSIFTEPAYVSKYGGDLNAYLKWDQLGKSDDASPKFRVMLAIYQRAMKVKSDGQKSPFEVVLSAI